MTLCFSLKTVISTHHFAFCFVFYYFQTTFWACSPPPPPQCDYNTLLFGVLLKDLNSPVMFLHSGHLHPKKDMKLLEWYMHRHFSPVPFPWRLCCIAFLPLSLHRYLAGVWYQCLSLTSAERCDNPWKVSQTRDPVCGSSLQIQSATPWSGAPRSRSMWVLIWDICDPL